MDSRTDQKFNLGEVASFTLGVQQTGIGEWRMDYDVLQPDFTPVDAVQWTENDVGFVLVFTPPCGVNTSFPSPS